MTIRLKHQFFVAHYLALGLNGTQAAIAAGYKPSNARFYASRLLGKANVREHLADKANGLPDLCPFGRFR